jgi:DNA-binding response OmpR family regulator
VDVAASAAEADALAGAARYDVVVLDASPPKLDGLALLRGWRAAGLDAHVLVVSTRAATRDTVAGLDAGADDYLARPFEVAELLARVRALVRRAYRQKDPVLRCHDLEIDTAARVVRRGGRVIRLTAREYALLEFLAFHRGRAVSRAMIREQLRGGRAGVGSNVVSVHVRSLRAKIDRGFAIPLILTRWGEGYVLRGDHDRPSGAS